MNLTLDHHYSRLIAEHLRDAGHDVVAAVERDWQREDDESLLTLCAAEERALLTNNVGDFALLARRWAASGQSHCGLIFTSDASLPRTRDTIGKYVQHLDDLLRQHPDPSAFTDRIHWL